MELITFMQNFPNEDLHNLAKTYLVLADIRSVRAEFLTYKTVSNRSPYVSSSAHYASTTPAHPFITRHDESSHLC